MILKLRNKPVAGSTDISIGPNEGQKMKSLWFKVDNAEILTDSLLHLTIGASVCGGLEEHGGIMGVIYDSDGSRVAWYVALINHQDPSGPAFAKFEYDPEQKPHPETMRKIFDALDTTEAEISSRPNEDDYPSMINSLLETV